MCLQVSSIHWKRAVSSARQDTIELIIFVKAAVQQTILCIQPLDHVKVPHFFFLCSNSYCFLECPYGGYFVNINSCCPIIINLSFVFILVTQLRKNAKTTKIVSNNGDHFILSPLGKHLPANINAEAYFKDLQQNWQK